MLTRPRDSFRAALRVRRGDERGSLIVAMTVIMIVVLLSSLIFAKVIGNQQIILSRQHVYSGVTGADAALSDALFRIDQGGSEVQGPTAGVFCFKAGDPQCITASSSTGTQLDGVEYVARTVPAGTDPSQATEWVVQAIGNAATGFHGAVQETLSRGSKYPFALFGKEGLTFTGNSQGGNFGTFTPGAPGVGSYTACSNTVSSPPCLLLGSNGSITCNGPSPLGVSGIIFATGNGGGSDSCGTATSQNKVWQVPDAQPPSGGTYTCPDGGQLGSGYGSGPNGNEYIAPGTYVCTSPVSISGTVMDSSTTDPVQLYIMTGSNYSNFLTIAGNSQINTTIPFGSLNNGSPGPPSGSTMPDPQLFQVFSNSDGNLTSDGVSNGFIFAGILYAPDAYLTNNGCKSSFLGSVTINTYTCNGSPNLNFWYDSQLQYDFGAWQVSGFQQINPSTVQIP
jgi:hypothetical protein